MTTADGVWLALNSLRASHRDAGCQRAGCAIASLYDEDLEEILHAIPADHPTRATITTMRPPREQPPALEVAGRRVRVPEPPAPMTVVDSGEPSPDGIVSEHREEVSPRFRIGDRVEFDPEAPVNLELDDYTCLGICTVTDLEAAADGQLLAFVDQCGNMHDGWWADRFRAAGAGATTHGGEGEVTYLVAFWSATGYGCRVLAPRPRIATAADVLAVTALLGSDVGGDVVPLSWVELPPEVPTPTRARPVALENRGSSEVRSTLVPIRNDRGNDGRSLDVPAPLAGLTPPTDPVGGAGPDERAELPYRPRRAM